ncbi:MAG: O-antigen ligase, partial [Bacteroidetes bacterium]|nr:O-antigen ligase [Bacteroidota bacterium]
DFYFLFYNHQLLFWCCLVFCAFLFYFVYKPYIISIFDPLLFSFIITSFGAADVLFMYTTHSIKSYYLINFTLTQFAFLGGLFLLKPFNSKKHAYEMKEFKLPFEESIMKSFFIICSILLIFIQIQVYVVAGIPLLSSSRLDTFTGGSGFGVLSRVIEVVQIFSVTLLFYFYFNSHRIKIGLLMRIYSYFFIFILVVFAVLSGSKSGILTILYSAFTAWIFSFNETTNDKVLRLIKKSKLYIISFIIIIALVVISVQSGDESNLNAIESLGMRFIFSGDVYWYAYPNDVIIGFSNYSGIKALFTDFIGFFRLDSWDNLTGHFGVDLYKYHHSTIVTQGPNARHNVFGLLYFGFWGSCIFSFVCGLTLTIIRNLLPVILPKNFISMCVLSYLYIKVAPTIDTDPILCLTYIDNLLIVTPILLILLLIVYYILFNNNAKSINSDSLL